MQFVIFVELEIIVLYNFYIERHKLQKRAHTVLFSEYQNLYRINSSSIDFIIYYKMAVVIIIIINSVTITITKIIIMNENIDELKIYRRINGQNVIKIQIRKDNDSVQSIYYYIL